MDSTALIPAPPKNRTCPPHCDRMTCVHGELACQAVDDEGFYVFVLVGLPKVVISRSIDKWTEPCRTANGNCQGHDVCGACAVTHGPCHKIEETFQTI